MYDVKKIMQERTLLSPLPTPDPAKFPRDEEVPEGCHVLENLADDWGYDVDIHTDIVYAKRCGTKEETKTEERELKLIILEPKPRENADTAKWPCVAYVQGSAFHEQWLWNNIPRHLRLAQKGYVVAVIQYRPSDIAPFPAQMQDAKTAIRFLKKHAEEYHIDPEHMAVAGDSSGAHTALMVGFTGDDAPDTDLYGEYSAKVNCIVDSYGPTVFPLMNYFESSQNHYDPESPEGYEIGYKNVLEHVDLAMEASPLSYLSEAKATPSTQIIHGGRDMLVPFSQSCQLYNYMKDLGKEVEFYKLNDANHGFLGFNNDTVLHIVLEFLKKHI